MQTLLIFLSLSFVYQIMWTQLLMSLVSKVCFSYFWNCWSIGNTFYEDYAALPWMAEDKTVNHCGTRDFKFCNVSRFIVCFCWRRDFGGGCFSISFLPNNVSLKQSLTLVHPIGFVNLFLDSFHLVCLTCSYEKKEKRIFLK